LLVVEGVVITTFVPAPASSASNRTRCRMHVWPSPRR
jgi:hypothetical protein